MCSGTELAKGYVGFQVWGRNSRFLRSRMKGHWWREETLASWEERIYKPHERAGEETGNFLVTADSV